MTSVRYYLFEYKQIKLRRYNIVAGQQFSGYINDSKIVNHTRNLLNPTVLDYQSSGNVVLGRTLVWSGVPRGLLHAHIRSRISTAGLCWVQRWWVGGADGSR